MPIAIFDPFSGISGDMTLGALIDVGVDPDWLRALPGRLGLADVAVRIERVRRSGIDCAKVEFEIPPQPHGRHLREIRALLADAGLPDLVSRRADAAFTAIAEAEGEIHGVEPDRVHLHEVGAVDAILDVVGAVWGVEQLDVAHVYCGPIALGDGTVSAAHGALPVPAPATLKLLEGHPVRPGPAGAGELVTPTGAALVRVLSDGPPPDQYVPLRSGFGAGTKDPRDRPNALRVVLAETTQPSTGGIVESLALLAADIDDMDAEGLAVAADALRAAGALDVVLIPALMKKGRPGTRLEVLARAAEAAHLEDAVLRLTTSIGVRRFSVARRALAREMRSVSVAGQTIRVKLVTLPDGTLRTKPEADDIARLAAAMGVPPREATELARRAAERLIGQGVEPAASAELA